MNKIQTAISKAADYIEANPKEFSFIAVGIPNGCGTPGCALGWIGHFYGMEPRENGIDFVASDILRLTGQFRNLPKQRRILLGSRPFNHFYNLMDKAEGSGRSDWQMSAEVCADALRKLIPHFADKQTFESFLNVALNHAVDIESDVTPMAVLA